MTTDDRESAWDAVFDALPAGWSVGRPSFYPERREWQQYAFDSFEVPKVGVRSKEWTAIGPTEVACVQNMARWLREISAGAGAAVARTARSERSVGARGDVP